MIRLEAPKSSFIVMTTATIDNPSMYSLTRDLALWLGVEQYPGQKYLELLRPVPGSYCAVQQPVGIIPACQWILPSR